MKKNIVLIFCLILSSFSMAQEQGIRITNQKETKEIIIRANKRIKIRTSNGQKISGRFTIADSNSIVIKDKIIEISDIESIKQNPLMLSIITSGFLIYGGAITAGIGAIIGTFVEPSAFLLVIPGGALIYTGIKSPNFLKNYKSDSDYTIELLSTSQ